MASTSEIRRRIASVQETQKITHAMYLISSAKMRKARAELDEVRPYFDVLNHEIRRVFTVDETVDSRYFMAYGSDDKSVGGTWACLVITADKGLAGAYNHNVLKEAQKIYDAHPDTEFYVIGEYGRRWFSQRKLPLVEDFRYTAQSPSTDRAQQIARDLLSRFASGEVDRLSVIYTDSKGMTEVVRQTQLLPLRRQNFLAKPGEEKPEPAFEFVPTMQAVLNSLVQNYISGYIYSALVDSFCSEQSARMAAMSAADDNAEELLGDLSKQFNRARQAAITQEITEISAGARAQKNKKSREANQA